MKSKVYFLLGFLSLSLFCANGQVRVLSNGIVQAGAAELIPKDNRDYKIDLMILGSYGEANTGSKLSFGDMGLQSNDGMNTFIGEYTTDDTDQLWLHGKKGFYYTCGARNLEIISYYDPAVNSSFVFNTDLQVNGVSVTSDARMKENVQSLENPLGILDQIQGISYTLSLSETKKRREQDPSKFSETPADSKIQPRTDAILSDAERAKAEKDEQIKSEIEKRDNEAANRKRMGFLAQDVQKVLPELVSTDEKGIMSVDYIGLIPIIVESIKEMQGTIEEQKAQISQLQGLLSQAEAQAKTKSNQIQPTNISLSDEASLYNANGASVGYSLPQTVSTANLRIFDITGRMIKDVILDCKATMANINSAELGIGTFIYALYVNGQKADTLKKYINK